MTDTLEARVARAIDPAAFHPSAAETDHQIMMRNWAYALARAAIAAMPKPGADSAELVKRLAYFGDIWIGWGDRRGEAGRTMQKAASLIEAQAARIAVLEEALREIATQDPADLALDPEWSQRIARAALGEKP